MNGDVAVAQVKQGLGFRSGTDLDAIILDTLNFAQLEREQPGKTLPWFLKAFDIAGATVANSNLISLPTGFIKLQEPDDASLYYVASTGQRFFLKSDSFVPAWRFFNGAWQGELVDPPSQGVLIPQTGIPRRFQIRATDAVLFPTPDQVYALYWNYFAHDVAITNTAATNGWLTYFPWAIIGDAGSKLAADMGNAAALQKFQQIAAASSPLPSIIERELAGRAIAMGSRL